MAEKITIGEIKDIARKAARSTARPLTEIELAKRWALTTRTLQGWRNKKIGPPYIVIGRNTVRYRLEDVIAYEKDRLKETNQGEGK